MSVSSAASSMSVSSGERSDLHSNIVLAKILLHTMQPMKIRSQLIILRNNNSPLYGNEQCLKMEMNNALKWK